MSNFDDVIIFGGTSLSDLFKQIHKNNKDTDRQILDLINIMKAKNGGCSCCCSK